MLLFCLKSLFSSSFLLFGVSLKYAFSLIRLKKSFNSASSSFLLYTFSVAIKFKSLFKDHSKINKMLLMHPSSVVSFQISFERFRNLDAYPKAWELKRNYLEHNHAYRQNMEECKPLHIKL